MFENLRPVPNRVTAIEHYRELGRDYDASCGAVARMRRRVVGIEQSPEMPALARERVRREGFDGIGTFAGQVSQ